MNHFFQAQYRGSGDQPRDAGAGQVRQASHPGGARTRRPGTRTIEMHNIYPCIHQCFGSGKKYYGSGSVSYLNPDPGPT